MVERGAKSPQALIIFFESVNKIEATVLCFIQRINKDCAKKSKIQTERYTFLLNSF